MRNLRKFLASNALVGLTLIAAGCSFSVSTANLSSLKTSTDEAGTSLSTTFKRGETIYARALVANNSGKVVVKFSVLADKAAGLSKGEKIMELPFPVEGSMTATFTLKPTDELPSGTYTLTADMINDIGEKKDSKSVVITYGDE